MLEHNLSPPPSPAPTCEHRPKLRRRPSPCSIAATAEMSELAAPSTKKSVSFGSHVAVRLIPKHQELTDFQYHATYYDAADLDAARENGLDDIRALRSGEAEASAENDYAGPCYRGIEHLVSRDAKKDRTERRRSYVLAVLLEQHRQISDNGYANEDDLSTAAQIKSHSDKVVARNKAKADEDAMRTESRSLAALAKTGKDSSNHSSQRKLAFIRNTVRIGSVRREDYRPLESARSA